MYDIKTYDLTQLRYVTTRLGFLKFYETKPLTKFRTYIASATLFTPLSTLLGITFWKMW